MRGTIHNMLMSSMERGDLLSTLGCGTGTAGLSRKEDDSSTYGVGTETGLLRWQEGVWRLPLAGEAG
jgi:hypothetical protein